MRLLLLLLCVVYSFGLFAQDSSSGKYWLTFRDKKASPYFIEKPESFLSKRAIDRRTRQGITLDDSDLPVTPIYLDSVQAAGASIIHTSRWFNGALVAVEWDSVFEALQNLHCIAKCEKRGDLYEINQFKKGLERKFKSEFLDTGSNVYGKSFTQINQLNGLSLHRRNFKGQGMMIALVDAGYYLTDKNVAFDSLWSKGLVLGSRDFAEPGEDVYASNYHGTSVLSLMAGNVPGRLIGTAPEASYWLLRTEDDGYELPVEEDNWVAGIEFADSVGVDVLNSSLGYNLFEDSIYNHRYNQYNGRLIRCSMAATMGARKGMLIVVSAGNEGSKPWRRITTPADADSVLTVGAVDEAGLYSKYSSQGPTADGRIKPDVVAMGTKPTFVNSSGKIDNNSRGTSFSAPIIAGLVSCLWQEFPKATNMQIIESVKKSASHYYHPDTLTGYGIPDFQKARAILRDALGNKTSIIQHPYPNPFSKSFTIGFIANTANDSVDVLITNIMGHIVLKQTFLPNTYLNSIIIDQLADLTDGIYFLSIKKQGVVHNEKIIKSKQ